MEYCNKKNTPHLCQDKQSLRKEEMKYTTFVKENRGMSSAPTFKAAMQDPLMQQAFQDQRPGPPCPKDHHSKANRYGDEKCFKDGYSGPYRRKRDGPISDWQEHQARFVANTPGYSMYDLIKGTKPGAVEKMMEMRRTYWADQVASGKATPSQVPGDCKASGKRLTMNKSGVEYCVSKKSKTPKTVPKPGYMPTRRVRDASGNLVARKKIETVMVEPIGSPFTFPIAALPPAKKPKKIKKAE